MNSRFLKTITNVCKLKYNVRFLKACTSQRSSTKSHFVKKEFQTEKKLSYVEDSDTFGTLTYTTVDSNVIKDEGDIKEEKYLQEIPLKSQKLTIRQYADLIKQYIKLKRLKEAIDVLEVRMLKEDRVKPENYIYNILIGACAEFGYTKKAFKLFNDMKKRALKPTGDTYTCLFEACISSPWSQNGLKNANNLRNLMIENGIEPNLTNYNVMIKAFGRCSDLPTAFKIVDEMLSKKIKIRVHTFNHLIQACISDKESGLKYALLVWRKMLKMREKPNIYSFNLMLKCVKDCNLGSKEDILEMLNEIHSEVLTKTQALYLNSNNTNIKIEKSCNEYFHCKPEKLSELSKTCNAMNNSIKECSALQLSAFDNREISSDIPTVHLKNEIFNEEQQNTDIELSLNKAVLNNEGHVACIDSVEMEMRNENEGIPKRVPGIIIPNLLSKVLKMDQVLSLQEVTTPQEKFATIGGQDDFLKEMNYYSVKPNIKTFTQMLPLLDDNTDAENKLLKSIEASKIKPDIDFYNMLIKKRCLRFDYDAAFEVRDLIEKESKSKKRHPRNKKHKLKFNIMTYGILALACKTKFKAEQLLSEMREKQLKVNIEILGTLLCNATHDMQFGYILYVINLVKQENLRVNKIFLKHLEDFNDKCLSIIEKNENENEDSTSLKSAYQRFNNIYTQWLKHINMNEVLEEEHPWQQFKEPQPVTVQRGSEKIIQPKKFYKRNRKFVKYTPKC